MRGKLQMPLISREAAIEPSMRPALYARETAAKVRAMAAAPAYSFNEARALCAGNCVVGPA